MHQLDAIYAVPEILPNPPQNRLFYHFSQIPQTRFVDILLVLWKFLLDFDVIFVYSNSQTRDPMGLKIPKIMKSMLRNISSSNLDLTAAPRSRITPHPIWKYLPHILSITMTKMTKRG